ncbi:MAG: porin [Xanthobacteraceae bacterium]|nr:porin [Xanthobacteraceae bacterium]
MQRLRQRQATQPGTQGTPQTQPGGTTPGSGAGGNIGQTQTPPLAGQFPAINVITDVAGSFGEPNANSFTFAWSSQFATGDWNQPGAVQNADPKDAPSTAAPKVAPVEYVKVCTLYGDGFFFVPGTDTCLKTGSYSADNAQQVGLEIFSERRLAELPATGLRPRVPVNLLHLVGTEKEKDTETGSKDGSARCFWINGSCTIPLTPEQGPAYGVPGGAFNLGVRYQVRYPDYQYGGNVANITGQPPHAPVQVPQGFQANAYDYSVDGNTFRRFGFRCAHDRPLVQLTNILQMTYSRIEDDPGRTKEPALDPDPTSGLSEKLPQARLDLRPRAKQMRDRR